MTMDTEREADDLAYAKLEAEMADGDEDLWGSAPSSRDDDDGGESGDPLEARERGGDDSGGDDEIERASLEADELEYQMRERAQYSQQQQRPDLYDDPIAHVREIQQEMQNQRSQREYQQFLGTIESHENAFKAMTPDYHEAVEHLERARRSELSKLYPDNSPQAHIVARQHGYATPAKLRDAVFINDAQTVARNALQSGRNPAHVYYELAADRGYQIKGPRAGRSSGGRSSGGKSGSIRADSSISELADLYTEDPATFDKQWDRMAKTGALG